MNSFLLLARFNQPIGTWLLLLPCLWSISIAAPDLPNFKDYILFAIGWKLTVRPRARHQLLRSHS